MQDYLGDFFFNAQVQNLISKFCASLKKKWLSLLLVCFWSIYRLFFHLNHKMSVAKIFLVFLLFTKMNFVFMAQSQLIKLLKYHVVDILYHHVVRQIRSVLIQSFFNINIFFLFFSNWLQMSIVVNGTEIIIYLILHVTVYNF